MLVAWRVYLQLSATKLCRIQQSTSHVTGTSSPVLPHRTSAWREVWPHKMCLALMGRMDGWMDGWMDRYKWMDRYE